MQSGLTVHLPLASLTTYSEGGATTNCLPSQPHSSSGYEVTNKQVPPGLSAEDVQCPICVEPLRDAFVTSCGHTFCYPCISTHLKHRRNCPNCSSYLTTDHIYPNFLLNKIVSKAAAAAAPWAASFANTIEKALQAAGPGVTGRELDAAITALTAARSQLVHQEASSGLHLLMLLLQDARRRKQTAADELRSHIEVLERDIAAVAKQQQQQQQQEQHGQQQGHHPLAAAGHQAKPATKLEPGVLQQADGTVLAQGQGQQAPRADHLHISSMPHSVGELGQRLQAAAAAALIGGGSLTVHTMSSNGLATLNLQHDQLAQLDANHLAAALQTSQIQPPLDAAHSLTDASAGGQQSIATPCSARSETHPAGAAQIASNSQGTASAAAAAAAASGTQLAAAAQAQQLEQQQSVPSLPGQPEQLVLHPPAPAEFSGAGGNPAGLAGPGPSLHRLSIKRQPKQHQQGDEEHGEDTATPTSQCVRGQLDAHVSGHLNDEEDDPVVRRHAVVPGGFAAPGAQGSRQTLTGTMQHSSNPTLPTGQASRSQVAARTTAAAARAALQQSAVANATASAADAGNAAGAMQGVTGPAAAARHLAAAGAGPSSTAAISASQQQQQQQTPGILSSRTGNRTPGTAGTRPARRVKLENEETAGPSALRVTFTSAVKQEPQESAPPASGMTSHASQHALPATLNATGSASADRMALPGDNTAAPGASRHASPSIPTAAPHALASIAAPPSAGAPSTPATTGPRTMAAPTSIVAPMQSNATGQVVVPNTQLPRRSILGLRTASAPLGDDVALRAAKKRLILTQFEDLQRCYLTLRTSDTFQQVLSGATTFSRMSRVAEIPRAAQGGPSSALARAAAPPRGAASSRASSANFVSCIDFDATEQVFATCSPQRVSLWNYASVLGTPPDQQAATGQLSSKAKLTGLAFGRHQAQLLACCDSEGKVCIYDTSTLQMVLDVEAHDSRVWALDFAPGSADAAAAGQAHCVASGSDDYTVRVWDARDGKPCTTIDTRANVCSVRYNPWDAHYLAVGSAAHAALVYDLRKAGGATPPLASLAGHSKAVSYVRWASCTELVSASTDSSLRLWDLVGSIAGGSSSGAGASGGGMCVRSYSGHVNERNFVGLSVDRDLIAAGSETNEVVIYYKPLSSPGIRHALPTPPAAQPGASKGGQPFISSLAWRCADRHLVAASSQGSIWMLALQQ